MGVGEQSIEEIRTFLICILRMTIYLFIDFCEMHLLVWYYATLTHVVVQLYSNCIIMILMEINKLFSYL